MAQKVFVDVIVCESKGTEESVSFEYEDYKNRQIDDVRTFIFAD